MGSRPRCRDWTALATQQLRLRNLIQISGHNIITAGTKSVVFYTLHPTTMSLPFFKSDLLETPQNAIWPEINCPKIVKSNALSVCIRVWRAKRPGESSDELLFLWGVYFSGLVPISKRTDVKLCENSLVFHIHGGFFTSAECLLPQNVPKQLDFIGVPDTKRRQRHVLPFPHKPDICDTLPALRHTIQHLETTKKPKELQTESQYTDASSMKVRYIEKQFYSSEIRASYNVDKLLLLQRKQRQLQKQAADAKNVQDEISMRSAFCLDLVLIAQKTVHNRGARTSSRSSTGLTLNRLLAKPTEPLKPEVLLHAQELRKQIEVARFRNKILLHERDEARLRVRRLEQKLTDLGDSNIEKESWLLANYHELRRDKETANHQAEDVRRMDGHLTWLQAELQMRRHQLLRELKEIYCIKRMKKGLFKINNAVLPNAAPFTEQFSVNGASHASVSLGYAAHLTTMIAVLLDQPLRNAIILKGSASRIRDDIKPLSDNDREYPLYCRSIPPPTPLRYGIYLLNQNICQLCYCLGAPVDDNSDHTLLNLLSLITFEPMAHHQPSPLLHRDGRPYKPPSLLSESTDKLSNVHETPAKAGLPNPLLSVLETNGADKRVSRSVGSYTDDEMNRSTRTNFGSAPNLAHTPVLTVFANNGNI